MSNLFEAMGGHQTFRRLVHRFYQGVREDEVLAPMYPQDDWEGAEERLTMFLEQYWGGPTTYQERRGHPMLRRRHLPFTVTPEARDRWLAHMRVGVDELELAADLEELLWDYLERAAHMMVNSPVPGGRSSLL
ncbi:globin [Georgenia subflava]|uniref:Globin n=1 Tax=Georgenia subflava TaxID=1622177 RepID=A0A6N7EKN8_9MICO|nr:globin [Georgenia subflava]MPV38709.1 globin [Georgenia subflava]